MITVSHQIPKRFLMPGIYNIIITIHQPNVLIYDQSLPLTFEIVDVGSEYSVYSSGIDNGIVFPPSKSVCSKNN